jgi:DnaJ-class molecular chaperone
VAEPVECSYCDGTGQKGRPDWHYDCPDCRGTGQVSADNEPKEVDGG